MLIYINNFIIFLMWWKASIPSKYHTEHEKVSLITITAVAITSSFVRQNEGLQWAAWGLFQFYFILWKRSENHKWKELWPSSHLAHTMFTAILILERDFGLRKSKYKHDFHWLSSLYYIICCKLSMIPLTKEELLG